ncbi:hypothetical protein [Aerosakkonema funiforme]|uniref:Uncharacterized protein n=1 Tax=Aerosakkonema funiforme FACHB-1375 TaxID=2949571 RepID=A0A926VC50_9CYAN|nr:hypothetical protein [Aerosakkonema funiforme]MBD2181076.1 hypothetical protein [Aerosakkonema funiforme FACHB-1375]
MINLRLLDRLGDWNPQLYREIKGRLKFRNLAVAGAVSVVTQCLIFLPFYLQVFSSKNYSNYCLKDKQFQCLVNPAGFVLIDWQDWWLDLFNQLSIIFAFVLLVGGVHMLIGDVGKEQRRGTLNFIKLSPQSSENILIGKILGAPILLYIGILLAIPLHLASAIGAGFPFGLLIGFYLLIGASCFLLYSTMLLQSFQVGFFTWPCTFLSLIFISPWLQILQGVLYAAKRQDIYNSNFQWFYLPIGSNLSLLMGFLLLNIGFWGYWSWQALNRRFLQPSATLISKGQSYWLVACLELCILGFFLGENLNSVHSNDYWRWFELIAFVECLNLFCFMYLIGLLSPQRQELQDWARYEQLRIKNEKLKVKSASVRSSFSSGIFNPLIQDLIWGEKSPVLVAIALNLVIKTVIWGGWIIFVIPNVYKIQALIVLILSANWILICAAIAQQMILMKTPKRLWWSLITINGLIVLPPLGFALLGISPNEMPGLWLLSALPWLGMQYASAITIFLSLLGQLSILGLLTLQLTKKLQKAGESASQSLFSAPPPL